jgi:hypothetical protein
MMRSKKLCAFWLALGMSLPACAGGDEIAPTSFEAAERQFVQAMTQSPDAMAGWLADDFIYLTTAGTVIGKQTLLEHLRSGRTVVLEAKRESTHLIERTSTMISSGLLTVKVRQDGVERTLRSRYLHTWSRSGPSDPWQLLSRQATTLAAGDR